MNIEWTLDRDKKPPKSGRYLVLKRYGIYSELMWSERHQLWNARDDDDNPLNAFPIVAWANKPKPKDVIDEANRKCLKDIKAN